MDDSEARRHQTKCIFAATLPPPVHGQSLINFQMRNLLEMVWSSGFVSVDLSPKSSKRGFKYHFARLKAALRGVLELLRYGYRQQTVLYTVKESGGGIIYNVMLLAAARAVGAKALLHHHTAAHAKQMELQFRFLIYLFPDAIHIALSPSMKHDLTGIYPALKSDQVVVVRNAALHPWVERRHFRRSGGARLRIGVISNNSVEKGIDDYFRTLETLARLHLDVEGIVCGPILDEEGARLAHNFKQSGICPIEFSGPIEQADVQRMLSTFDVFLFPTRYKYEAQPLVLLEALAAGVPVITRNVGYVAELVGSGGLVINADDQFEVAAAETIALWESHPRVREIAGDLARERYDEERDVGQGERNELISILAKMAGPR